MSRGRTSVRGDLIEIPSHLLGTPAVDCFVTLFLAMTTHQSL